MERGGWQGGTALRLTQPDAAGAPWGQDRSPCLRPPFLPGPALVQVWGLAGPLAYVLAISVGVGLYHEAADAGLAPVLW